MNDDDAERECEGEGEDEDEELGVVNDCKRGGSRRRSGVSCGGRVRSSHQPLVPRVVPSRTADAEQSSAANSSFDKITEVSNRMDR